MVSMNRGNFALRGRALSPWCKQGCLILALSLALVWLITMNWLTEYRYSELWSRGSISASSSLLLVEIPKNSTLSADRTLNDEENPDKQAHNDLTDVKSAEARSPTASPVSPTASPVTPTASPVAPTSPPQPSTQFHYVFSTGCSSFQDWQSYVLFFAAKKVGLEGVTRIASGCKSDRAAARLQKSHEEQVKTLSENFHLHQTPSYAGVIPGHNYKFFNKPFGLLHWLETSLGFPNKTDYEDTVFVLMDPDEIVIRPFVKDMSAEANNMVWRTRPKFPVKVEHGLPFGQIYGLGTHWMHAINANLSHVLSSLNDDEAAASSQLHQWTKEKVHNHYVVGPPYLFTGRDMYRIVSTWAKFAVPVYELTQDHLSEMFAYSTAAAHLGLDHQLTESFMVSHVHSDQEGWKNIDAADSGQVCTSNYTVLPAKRLLPNVLHYCQHYMLGPYFFCKYYFPDHFLSCEHPLMYEPEEDLADKYTQSIRKDGSLYELEPFFRKRTAFFLCNLLPLINAAAHHWKSQHCDAAQANFSYAYRAPWDNFILGR